MARTALKNSRRLPCRPGPLRLCPFLSLARARHCGAQLSEAASSVASGPILRKATPCELQKCSPLAEMREWRRKGSAQAGPGEGLGRGEGRWARGMKQWVPPERPSKSGVKMGQRGRGPAGRKRSREARLLCKEGEVAVYPTQAPGSRGAWQRRPVHLHCRLETLPTTTENHQVAPGSAPTQLHQVGSSWAATPWPIKRAERWTERSEVHLSAAGLLRAFVV